MSESRRSEMAAMMPAGLLGRSSSAVRGSTLSNMATDTACAQATRPLTLYQLQPPKHAFLVYCRSGQSARAEVFGTVVIPYVMHHAFHIHPVGWNGCHTSHITPWSVQNTCTPCERCLSLNIYADEAALLFPWVACITFTTPCVASGALRHQSGVATSFANIHLPNTSWPWSEQTRQMAENQGIKLVQSMLKVAFTQGFPGPEARSALHQNTGKDK
jgi:hypothetical protein